MKASFSIFLNIVFLLIYPFENIYANCNTAIQASFRAQSAYYAIPDTDLENKRRAWNELERANEMVRECNQSMQQQQQADPYWESYRSNSINYGYH